MSLHPPPMTELELKLQVPAERRAQVAAALDTAQWDLLPLEAHYFDTADGTLAAHGISLRVRREGPRWLQTLKAGGASPVQRLEHELALEPPATGSTPFPELRHHQDTPAADALKAAWPGSLETLQAALVERYATRIERRRRELTVAQSRIEAVLDEGEIVAGRESLPVCELELELKSGSAADLLDLGRRWIAEQALCLSTISKAQRGECLARGLRHGPAVKAGAPVLQRSMSQDALLRSLVSSCLAQILPNASELAAGSGDGEHVHQLRVGIRRLRTALRELGDFSADVDPGWEPVLVQAFRRLGELRDQTSVASAIQPRLGAAGAPRSAWPQAAQDPVDPGATVRDTAFQTVLIELLRFSLQAGDAGKKGHARSVRSVLRSRLAKLHRRIVRDAGRFTALSVEEQHRVRKRLKRLRYLGEFVAPLFKGPAVERYLSQLRPAQDALGVHNDEAVALEAYRRAVETDPEAWFAVGWLTAHRQQTARQCRKALRKIADARRFWKKSGK